MNLEQVRSFLYVVEFGSFSQASIAYLIPQPTISRHIKQLEQHFSLKLFQRTAGHSVLTEHGLRFLPHATEIIAAVDNAQNSMLESKEKLQGELVVEAPPGLIKILVNGFVPVFHRQYPSIILKFVSLEGNRWFEQIKGDIRLHLYAPREELLITRRFLQSSVNFYASPTFIKKHPKLLHPKQLSNYPCILSDFGKGSVDSWSYKECGQKVDVKVSGILKFDFFDAAQRAAIDGVGVLRAAELNVREQILTGQLQALFEPSFAIQIYANIYFRDRELQPAKERVFIDTLIEFYQHDYLNNE